MTTAERRLNDLERRRARTKREREAEDAERRRKLADWQASEKEKDERRAQMLRDQMSSTQRRLEDFEEKKRREWEVTFEVLEQNSTEHRSFIPTN